MVYQYTTIVSFYNTLAASKDYEDKRHHVFWVS